MRQCMIWLATVGLVYASPNVFNVHDDFLAFPQVSMSTSHLIWNAEIEKLTASV